LGPASGLALEEVAKLLVEAINATSGINDLLFAGVERVALGAHLDVERFFAHGGLGGELVTAGAGNGYFFVVRLNIGLHGFSFSLGYRGFACTSSKRVIIQTMPDVGKEKLAAANLPCC
jgi:hypothetical protein